MRVLSLKVFSLFVAGGVLLQFPLQAEPIPDAGSILREQQLQQRQLPQQLPVQGKESERTPLIDSGVRVAVKGFTFSGYEGLATEGELQSIVSASFGKTLSFGELQAEADKVTAFLKKKGWFLARAYLPKQDVTSGIIEIVITQGKSDGTISIKTDKSGRVYTCILHNIVKPAVLPGQPINEKRLERSVLLMNDLPGINARASLAPGRASGSSGVQVNFTEGPLLKGVLWGDNYGNRYTGAWRANTMLSLNDPSRRGDQLTVMLTGADGLKQGRIGYNFPIAYDGVRGNFAYTGMHYNLIGELAPLQYEGRSNGIDAGLSYPLHRSRTSNVNTSATYSYKALLDTRSNIEIRDRNVNSVTFNGNGDIRDTMFGGGLTSWNIGLTTGSFHESVADITYAKTEGKFSRLNFGMSRQQHLTDRATLNLSWSGQAAFNNLDSSEKFSLGGPNSLRAYPVGEGSGDQGHLINTDLRYNLPLPPSWGSVQLDGFYDAGYITINKEDVLIALGTATNRNDYWLQGAGLGLNYTSGGKFAVRGSWAHVIGDNPGRSITGNNSDGRNDKYRFWLQSMVFF